MAFYFFKIKHQLLSFPLHLTSIAFSVLNGLPPWMFHLVSVLAPRVLLMSALVLRVFLVKQISG